MLTLGTGNAMMHKGTLGAWRPGCLPAPAGGWPTVTIPTNCPSHMEGYNTAITFPRYVNVGLPVHHWLERMTVDDGGPMFSQYANALIRWHYYLQYRQDEAWRLAGGRLWYTAEFRQADFMEPVCSSICGEWYPTHTGAYWTATKGGFTLKMQFTPLVWLGQETRFVAEVFTETCALARTIPPYTPPDRCSVTADITSSDWSSKMRWVKWDFCNGSCDLPLAINFPDDLSWELELKQHAFNLPPDPNDPPEFWNQYKTLMICPAEEPDPWSLGMPAEPTPPPFCQGPEYAPELYAIPPMPEWNVITPFDVVLPSLSNPYYPSLSYYGYNCPGFNGHGRYSDDPGYAHCAYYARAPQVVEFFP